MIIYTYIYYHDIQIGLRNKEQQQAGKQGKIHT